MAKRVDSCVMPFRNVILAAVSSNVSNTLLSPNAALSPRMFAEAEAWAHFRVRKLKFRLHPRNATTNDQAAAFLGGVQDTLPTTVAIGVELISGVFSAGDSTVPTNWVSVPRSQLAGPLPWYKTIPGTADATEEAPGYLVVQSGGATDNYALEVVGEFEFKTSVNTANTPLARNARIAVVEERVRLGQLAAKERLLKVLATPTSSTVTCKDLGRNSGADKP